MFPKPDKGAKGKAMPIAALIGMAHPEDGKGEDGPSHDDAKEAMDMFVSAVHDRDTEGALKAFEQLQDLCSDYEDEDEGEDEEG